MLSRPPRERCVSALLLLCGLGHSSLDPIFWHQWWRYYNMFVCRMTLNLIQNLPDPRFLCIPPSFWKIPPTAFYTAKPAGADPKSGHVRKPESQSHPTSWKTNANTDHQQIPSEKSPLFAFNKKKSLMETIVVGCITFSIWLFVSKLFIIFT